MDLIELTKIHDCCFLPLWAPISIYFQVCPCCYITHALLHDGGSGTEPHFLFLFTKIFEQPTSLSATDVPKGAE